ncbi:hypothetical protein EDD85DRAFT_789320 [Armillaria nabsnona]|nr:hypothetical protein EDD85DRAFT_789320 [Armillaria nabsnona]
MVDDLEEYGDLFTARDMLARLWKYFGLGDHIQANAAHEALRNFTVDMCNIPKYVQKWRSTILTLRAEHYPIGYIDTVLNFISLITSWILTHNGESIPHPPDRSSLPRANYADAPDPPPSDDDVGPVDPEAYAVITDIPYTDCTVNSVNEDIVFVCSGASFLNPSSEVSTWFYDGLQAGTFAALSLLVKMMLDSGCTTHIFKDKKYFWSYREDEAVDVKTANCGVLSTKACGCIFSLETIGLPLISPEITLHSPVFAFL